MPDGITSSDYWTLKFLEAKDWFDNSTIGTITRLSSPLYGFLSEIPAAKKYWEDLKAKCERIKIGEPYYFVNARIETSRRVGGPNKNDISSAFMIDKDILGNIEKRWFPNDGQQIFTSAHPKFCAIETTYDLVSFTVSNNNEFLSPFSKARFFTIQPGSKVDFIKNVIDGRYYFILRSGEMIEDKSFKTAVEFDEMMGIYASVADTLIGSSIIFRINAWKKANLFTVKNSLEERDFLANKVMAEVGRDSGLFGILTGIAPPIMAAVEWAYNWFLNTLKAQMAYGISYCYTGKELNSDELKTDLYVLFGDDDVGVSMKNIADSAMKAANIDLEGIAWDLAGKEELYQKLGTWLLGVGKNKCQNLARDVEMVKNTSKGIAKGVPIVSSVISVGTNMYQASKFGVQAQRYYRPKVAAGSAPKTGKDAMGMTVTFDAQGGYPRPESRLATAGYAYGTLPIVNQQGYKFDGWFTEAKGGKEVKSTSQVPEFVPNQTLYAHWTAIKVRINFDTHGGTPQPQARDVIFGAVYGDLPNNVTKSKNNFSGWYFLPDGGGAQISKNTPVRKDDFHTLHAYWTPQGGMTVTFDSNGGSVPSPVDKVIQPGSQYGTLPTVTRSGHKLDGWFTEAYAGTKVDEKTVFTGSNKTLYAHWSSISGMTVTFDSNGGDKPSFTTKGAGPGYAFGSLPTVTRSGYKSDGWFTQAVGGTKVDEKTVFNGSNKTLYAHWSPISGMTVTFDANGGDKPSFTTKGLNPGSSKYGELPTVSRTGYKFDGWFTQAVGGTKVDENSLFTGISTIYAHWTEINPTSKPAPTPTPAPTQTCIVSFRRNSGNDTIPAIVPMTVPYNSKVTLPTPSSRPNHTFVCWNTQENGKGASYSGSMIVTEKIELWAQWKENVPPSKPAPTPAPAPTPPPPQTFIVSFHRNSGSDTIPEVAPIRDVPYNSRVNLPTPSRPNHTFVCWNTKENGSGASYSGTMTVTEKTELWAQWKENAPPPPQTFIVSFHRNSGSDIIPEVPPMRDVPHGSRVTLPTPSRPNHAFVCWNTKENGSGASYSGTMTVTEKTELWAQWKENVKKVTVTFYPGFGNTVSTPSTILTVGSPYGTLPTATSFQPTKEIFSGWYNDKGEQITANSIVTNPNDHRLSANFSLTSAPTPQSQPGPSAPSQAQTCIVSFHRNSGSDTIPAIEPMTVPYNSWVTLPTPSRPNHDFVGWNTQENGYGASYSGGITVTAKTELWAQWRANTSYSTPSSPAQTYIVSFHRNSGSDTIPEVAPMRDVPHGGRVTLPTPSRPNYNFVGWNTQENGNGTPYSGTITVTAKLELWAQWRKK
jgi:uncharacterized repeat protein (TIGR02543 family)